MSDPYQQLHHSSSSSFKILRFRRSLAFLLLCVQVQLPFGQKAIAQSIPSQTSVTAQPNTSSTLCPANLKAEIEAIMDRPEFDHSRWGIFIQTLSTKTTLYTYDADKYFIPASNTKLLTTAAVLYKLGVDFRIRTSVYGDQANSTRLRVVGRGDPSFTNDQLQALVQQLKRQGIHHIEQLMVEEGYFSEPILNPTWEWEDLVTDYATSVNSLILNQNAALLTLSPQQIGQPLKITWSDSIAQRQWQINNNTLTAATDSPSSVDISGVLGKPLLNIRGQMGIQAEPMEIGVAILNPADYFSQHLQNALSTAGISVGDVLIGSNVQPNNESELAAIDSPPLASLVLETNQESNSLYAEALLRTLGTSQPVPGQSTAESGLQQVKAILTQLGVDPDSYVQADGSGLSRRNLVSPTAVVQTLQAIAKTPVAKPYKDSLPVAGVSGTLKNRFQNTPAQGIVHAKTGTLTGASSLSGYLDSPSYQPLVFSLMVNQSDQPTTAIRQAIDEMVVLLTRLQSC